MTAIRNVYRGDKIRMVGAALKHAPHAYSLKKVGLARKTDMECGGVAKVGLEYHLEVDVSFSDGPRKVKILKP
jgi:hypothetical protein